jgi:hypothetical protein
MKRKVRPIHLVDGIVALIALVVVFATFVHLSDSTEDFSCEVVGKRHEVTLQNDTFSQRDLTAQRCDTISVINMDSQNYDLNFGEHDDHVSYPGYDASLLRPNEQIFINAIKTGKYEFHDHLRDNAQLNLTVE